MCHDQFPLSKHWTSRDSVLRIGLRDVSKPTRSHGRTELISQIVNLLSDCSALVRPNVVRNTQITTKLPITTISKIIAIIAILKINSIIPALPAIPF